MVSFFVVPSLPHEVILGMDFWRAFGLVVNTSQNNASVVQPGVPKVDEVVVDRDVLDERQRKALEEMVERFRPTLGRPGLGCTHLITHSIDTGNAAPVRQRYYSYSPRLIEVLHAGLEDWLNKGVVEPSSSPWASPSEGHQLYKLGNCGKRPFQWNRVLPRELRADALHECHDVGLSHLGVNKTIFRLREYYYWPSMDRDVREYGKKCEVCIKYKVPQVKPAGVMGVQRKINAPMQKFREEIEKRLKASYEKNKVYYNLRRRPLDLQVGDTVYRENHVQSNAVKYFSKKLAPKFIGPFTVAKKVGYQGYLLKDADGKTDGPWHVKHLKKS
ncbi:Pro-Pol polyprotein [Frankliniella fusca]|uniref:RNA-directed DNA polymerase n=1 Tax=Frankliniella fusca TaxID=407009 RepID=A0AAE1LFJ8_9NEOP|nr:Pro-Pol polyprotein [Frankliniella fusca]